MQHEEQQELEYRRCQERNQEHTQLTEERNSLRGTLDELDNDIRVLKAQVGRTVRHQPHMPAIESMMDYLGLRTKCSGVTHVRWQPKRGRRRQRRRPERKTPRPSLHCTHEPEETQI